MERPEPNRRKLAGRETRTPAVALTPNLHFVTTLPYATDAVSAAAGSARIATKASPAPPRSQRCAQVSHDRPYDRGIALNNPELDLSTPEKTLHVLEEAYRSGDFDLAQRCRNFEHEAELIQQHLRPAGGAAPPVARHELAESLQRQWRQSRPPDFLGVSTQVVAVEHFAGRFFTVTQNIRAADGRAYTQRTFMSHTENGWAVLCPVPAYEPPQETKPWWVFWR